MINVFTHVKEITYIIINKLSTLCVSLLCWGTLGGLWINIPSLYLRDTATLEIIPYITSHEITKLKPFEKLPPFYKQVIEGYVQCSAPYTSGSHSNDNTVNVLNMCIWGNRNIKNKTGDILYFPNWIRSGI